MFGFEQMITTTIPFGSWMFVYGMILLGVWKLFEITMWILTHSGKYTPSQL